MSFRLFVYYCGLVGAWTAILGWMVGRVVADRYASDDNPILQDGYRGLCLGLFVALGVGVVDSIGRLGGQRLGWRGAGLMAARAAVATVGGGVGGFIGGSLAQWLVGQFGNRFPVAAFFVLGWTLAGILIGVSLGLCDGLVSLVTGRGRGFAAAKTAKCLLGGGLGGLVGALAAYTIREAWLALFASKDPVLLWSPTALGSVMLGLFIGGLVALTQVVLRTAWVRIEAGFRPGRDVILSKDATCIGRAEECDIGLFGDPAVDKNHARIVLDGAGYVLEDGGTSAGTFVNERRVAGRLPLRSGDLIRIGRNVLRFQEKRAGA